MNGSPFAHPAVRNATVIGGVVGAATGAALGWLASVLAVLGDDLRRRHHMPELPPETARRRRDAHRAAYRARRRYPRSSP